MKLKVCGLKYPDNIKQIAELNPDYMGFIFYDQSKRYVGENFIMPEIASTINKVGVFVNASAEYIEDKVKKYKLNFVQLHGDETPEFCTQIATFTKVIKAIGVDETFDLGTLNAYKKSCTYFLFDNKTGTYGGSGKPFNWSILEQYDNELPYFLAGGMDIEKFRAVSKMNLKIHAIDVNSKAEIKPGYKDIIKIIQIRNNIR